MRQPTKIDDSEVSASIAGPVAPDSDWTALAARGQRRRYRKGTILMNEGEAGGSLMVILRGRVKAFLQGRLGRELVLGVYGPGDYLGEMSLDGGVRSASVITMESVECSVLDHQAIIEHIKAHPEFALNVIARVIQRARLATAMAGNLALLDVYGRVVQQLGALAQRRPDGTSRVLERLTHQELADRVGASREMVSKILKSLADGGYLVSDSSGFTLLRPLPIVH